MINELYTLSQAMQKYEISGRAQYRYYLSLPNVKKDAPCIQILLSKNDESGNIDVVSLRGLPQETVKELRKYGDKQKSYPAMNLAALYRVTDKESLRLLGDLRSGKTVDFDLEQLKSWCQTDNWNSKFLRKYKNCFQKVPEKLKEFLKEYPDNPIFILFRQTEVFQNPEVLRQKLEKCAFRMLEEKKDIPTAIQMLFYFGDADKDPKEDFKNLSVILDSTELVKVGYSTISAAFTNRLNEDLLKADEKNKSSRQEDTVDAFGTGFAAVEEPMPEIKLPEGFIASLRTMFKEHKCQYRYGRIENATYPIAPATRLQLKSALEWVSAEERRNITWSKLDTGEILFAYPESKPSLSAGLAAVFQGSTGFGQSSFEGAAKRFLSSLREGKDPGTDSRANRIQIFILRKLDKGRTKIVYTYNTTPEELEQRGEIWWTACHNLPELPRIFESENSRDLFPLEAANLLNSAWKQDGTLASKKFKPFSGYHGLELFFDDGSMARNDLSALLRNLEPVAVKLGRYAYHLDKVSKTQEIFQKSFLLLGLLLDRLGSRKEQYMQEFPYLYGQLLKVSDEMHILYCRVERDGDFPPQLVGGSFYNAAAELPLQTLTQLGQRMIPYISWAKAYQYKNRSDKEKESWRAGWYLRLYERLASQIAEQTELKTKFIEAERAQMFIGYLAQFPQSDKQNSGSNENKITEETDGGTNHEVCDQARDRSAGH